MVFSSTVFMFLFLPFVFLLSYALPGIKLKNALLLIASVLFYAWGEPVYILLMIASTFVNYLLALPGDKAKENPTLKRAMLIITVVFNIGLLAVFKYTGFAVETLNSFGLSLPMPQITLPVGISFYTFQVMSYVIDVYRGDANVQRNYFKVLLYVSFFPQLIAGPIVKYHDVEAQIDDRKVTVEGIAQGIRRFVFGLTKKLLIANAAGEMVDTIYASSGDDINAPLAWLCAIAYCIQIYYDFSGYSDMAIGLGKMAGFDFKENFTYPYTATSIQDFWRKWHISLSTWFKEYVYIPLGGNRKGKIRTGVNKVIVFFLTGLWHGASWTFVIWGLIHGLFIMLEAYNIINPEKWKPKFLARIYTLFVVCLAFVLFRADTFAQAWDMIKAMFTGFSMSQASAELLSQVCKPFSLICVGLGIICSAPILRPLWHTDRRLTAGDKTLSVIGYVCTVPMYLICVLLVAISTYNPFIYFRF